MAEQWGHQLAEQRKRLGFTQAGLAEIMGVTRAVSPRSSTVKSLLSRLLPATSLP
jgi:transcriptional regulator with XRE-family HTH domain